MFKKKPFIVDENYTKKLALEKDVCFYLNKKDSFFTLTEYNNLYELDLNSNVIENGEYFQKDQLERCPLFVRCGNLYSMLKSGEIEKRNVKTNEKTFLRIVDSSYMKYRYYIQHFYDEKKGLLYIYNEVEGFGFFFIYEIATLNCIDMIKVKGVFVTKFFVYKDVIYLIEDTDEEITKITRDQVQKIKIEGNVFESISKYAFLDGIVYIFDGTHQELFELDLEQAKCYLIHTNKKSKDIYNIFIRNNQVLFKIENEKHLFKLFKTRCDYHFQKCDQLKDIFIKFE